MQPGQHWVEIGPGQGALTAPLLQHAISLDVIELDRDLVRLLQNKFSAHPNLTIHSEDALRFNFASLVKDSEPLHIIGNLPYNISTPLMFHLLSYSSHIAQMHFMLQKEVVQRICAKPGNKNYGRLSIMMQLYCAAEQLFEVPPECFSPAPKVTSAIVRLVPHKKIPFDIHSVDVFSKLVVQAFSQRRKTVRNSLKGLVSVEVFETLAIDSTLRAENLALEDFARLSNAIHQPQ